MWCGIDLRPVPGLRRGHDLFPTAAAVGYYLSPFGLGGGTLSKSMVGRQAENASVPFSPFSPWRIG